MNAVPKAWDVLSAECPANGYHLTSASSDEPGGPFVGVFIKLPDDFEVSPSLLRLVDRDVAKAFVKLLGEHGVVSERT